MTFLDPPAFSYLSHQLQGMEQYRQYPYKDINGYETIGYGRNLHAQGISRAEAIYLLNNNISEAEDEIIRNIPFYKDLDMARKIVLVNMCFNMGIEGLMQFHSMLKALSQGLYAAASAYMFDSEWARQLPARAEILSKIMQSGVIS